ncbi:MAG TPA: glycosyltransferase family 4 protein [Chloroflexota bacterium]|nr:glycosyltransferase family 4 protein [Chloroflexota bacterium]
MRPHVLYVTPILGYPAIGGPRLRTYNTLRALARCADVSVVLTDQPDTADRRAAQAHLLTFCRDVEFPLPNPSAAGRSRARSALRVLVPSPVRRVVRRWLTGPHAMSLEPPAGAALAAARIASLARRRVPGLGRSQRSDADRALKVESGEPAARDPRVVDGLRDRIAREQPDLVWLGFGGISYDLVPLRAQTGKPLVLETECVWSRFVLRELPFAADESQRQRIVRAGRAKEAEERAGAALVDLTTAVSEVDAEYFRGLAADPGRVMLLANVIDVDAYQQAPTPPTDVRLRPPALIFAGSLSRGTANVDATGWLVDEVLPIVWRRRPDVHVYLVGRSPAPEILARRGPRIHVTGEVPSIAPYLRASVAALVPLRWESGTRFKILEAFACRTPVVSTTLGAEGLAVEHGRHLLLADDPVDFASAILSLVETPALRERLVEPAYDLVRAEYDLSSAERQINAILARLGVLHEAVRP